MEGIGESKNKENLDSPEPKVILNNTSSSEEASQEAPTTSTESEDATSAESAPADTTVQNTKQIQEVDLKVEKESTVENKENKDGTPAKNNTHLKMRTRTMTKKLC